MVCVLQITIYGLWFMVYGLWFMVHGLGDLGKVELRFKGHRREPEVEVVEVDLCP